MFDDFCISIVFMAKMSVNWGSDVLGNAVFGSCQDEKQPLRPLK